MFPNITALSYYKCKCILFEKDPLRVWCSTALSARFQLNRESVLLMEETEEPGKYHRPVASH